MHQLAQPTPIWSFVTLDACHRRVSEGILSGARRDHHSRRIAGHQSREPHCTSRYNHPVALTEPCLGRQTQQRILLRHPSGLRQPDESWVRSSVLDPRGRLPRRRGPWHFVIVRTDKREAFGEVMADVLRRRQSDATSEML